MSRAAAGLFDSTCLIRPHLPCDDNAAPRSSPTTRPSSASTSPTTALAGALAENGTLAELDLEANLIGDASVPKRWERREPPPRPCRRPRRRPRRRQRRRRTPADSHARAVRAASGGSHSARASRKCPRISKAPAKFNGAGDEGMVEGQTRSVRRGHRSVRKVTELAATPPCLLADGSHGVQASAPKPPPEKALKRRL